MIKVTNLAPPPLSAPFIGKDGKISPDWAKYMQATYTRMGGSSGGSIYDAPVDVIVDVGQYDNEDSNKNVLVPLNIDDNQYVEPIPIVTVDESDSTDTNNTFSYHMIIDAFSAEISTLNPITNDVLQFDGIKWVNMPPSYMSAVSPTFSGGMTGDLLTLSSATTMKQKFIATSVTSMGYLNMDASSLFMSNNAWHNGAWQTDDTTKKKFAYLQHLGTGRHEFRSSAVGATVTWVNSLIMDETSASFAVPFGYGTGAGGTVTQLTSKATGVTLNKSSGAITMNNAALASGSVVQFTLTNSTIASTDVVIVHRKSGGTANSYQIWVDSIATGAVAICVRNISTGSLSEAVVIAFSVIKGSTS